MSLSFQEIKACIEDLNTLLRIDPKNIPAEKLLLEVQKTK